MRPFLLYSLLLLPSSLLQATTEPPAEPQAGFQLNIKQDNPPLAESLSKGMQSLLLGHSEAAKLHFLKALKLQEEGEISPLAHCGLILSCSGVELSPQIQEQYQQSLKQLKELKLDEAQLHPQEERYLNCLSLLLSQNYTQAGDTLAQLAQQYRGDTGLALWATLLLHDCYDHKGQASDRQKQALQLAEQNLQRNPDKALVHYLRALIEENAPSISDQAMISVDKAIAGMEDEAMPHLLKAHLLYRQEQLEDSLAEIIIAEEKASAWQKRNDLHWRENSVWVRARLYHLSLLHQLGRESDYLQLYASTIRNNLPLSASALEQQKTCLSQAELLYYWELKTHPLRMNLGNPRKLSQQALNASISKERLIHSEHPALATLPDYGKCLVILINAQRYMEQGKSLEAQAALESGMEMREKLRKQWIEVGNYSLASNIYRAMESCDIGVNMVRIGIFKNTTEIWETRLREVTRLSSMLMPPVVIEVQKKAE